MARFGSARITGLEEIDKLLKQLPETVARNITRRALVRAAKVVEKEMRARAPVGKTGNLKASIGQVGVRGLPGGGQARQVGALKGGRFKGYHAHLVEFGTSTAAPHPFIRPAWDETRTAALKILVAELGKGVEKQALRIAGSFAKSGLGRKRRRRRK